MTPRPRPAISPIPESPLNVQFTSFALLTSFSPNAGAADESKVVAAKLVLNEKTQLYFERLGHIAEIIGALQLTDQKNIYALSYGLILIGEIAVELLKKPKSLLQANGAMH
jgi:hypothetical protein